MEIVHDRERERYSKHISRTFTRGTYYLEVNANHPDYILRTRVLPVPPYDDPAQAVEAGMHYIINVGDAWFAQVPREGNIFVRADNMHDTGHALHRLPPVELLDRGQPGRPPQRLSDPLQVELPVRDRPDRQLDHAALRRRRPLLAAVHRDPAPGPGQAGGHPADFEREVSGRETTIVERFGPFLKAAWEDRRDLPADELNGVVPLDSKFGFAWRDWRVLTELAAADRARRLRQGRGQHRRHPRRAGRRQADRDASGPDPPALRLVADRQGQAFANKIKRETGALLALQNPDGGWHEIDAEPGPSAVYTTGQLA